MSEPPAGGDAADRPSRRRPRVSDGTPRERQELDPGSCCPECGGDLHVMGEDVSEMLDLIAAQLKVVQIARLKKFCRRCERMVQLPAPSRPIPGSMAGAGLLATSLSPSLTTIFRFIARTRSSLGWVRTFPTARWSPGAAAP